MFDFQIKLVSIMDSVYFVITDSVLGTKKDDIYPDL